MRPMGYEIKITPPLDWMGVSDHSEYVGVIQEANDPPQTPRALGPAGCRVLARVLDRNPAPGLLPLSPAFLEERP